MRDIGITCDVIKWKHFPLNWRFFAGNSPVPVTSPHKCQRRGALMFSLICVWINGWVNNREAGEYYIPVRLIVMNKANLYLKWKCVFIISCFKRFAVFCDDAVKLASKSIHGYWPDVLAIIQSQGIRLITPAKHHIEAETSWPTFLMTYSNALTSRKFVVFWLKFQFQWNMFTIVQLTTIQHWFR